MAKRSTALLSPLRYPGSKRRLIPYVKDVLAVNQLHPKLFVEPFAGGASVALQLLHDTCVDKIGLADADPLIASFWQCVFFDTEWLIEAISEMHVSLKRWNQLKASQPKSARTQAIKCLYLNRTSFSGILADTAGPIGGQTQTSEYDIACRFNPETLIHRIKNIGEFRDKVAFIWACDWKRCIEKTLNRFDDWKLKDLFFYLDPPFYFKAERLYSYFFNEQEHLDLHNLVTKLKAPWLLSYDPAKAIKRLYRSNGTRPKKVELIYSITSAGQAPAQELIISNLVKLPSSSSKPQRQKP